MKYLAMLDLLGTGHYARMADTATYRDNLSSLKDFIIQKHSLPW